MAVIHKWRVVIIMAHDGESSFEYLDLKTSILERSGFDNLSYIIFDYNQTSKTISINSPVFKENVWSLEPLVINNEDISQRFIGKDFYDKNTLIQFIQFVKGMENLDNDAAKGDVVTFRYFMITFGHGAGLFYFPSGKIEELVNKIGIRSERNNSPIGVIKQKFNERLLAYIQFYNKNSDKSVNSFVQPPFPFLTINMFRDTRQFLKREQKELYSVVASFNKNVVNDLKFYTAADLNSIFDQGDLHIEVYFALNCFTQMIETGFELRHTIDMMVAPQTTIPLTGINYKEVFGTLKEKPFIKLQDLSEVIVSSYKEKYTPEFIKEFKSHYPDFDFTIVSFSCNFLKEYKSLVGSLNELTDFIKKIYTQQALIKYKRKVGDARKLCGDLTPGNNFGFIDLSNFLVQLLAQLPGIFTQEITAIKDRLEFIKKTTLASIKKPDAESSVPGKPPNNPSFLSFFAPAFKGGGYVIKFLLAKYTSMNNEYSTESGWDDFVLFFYRNTSRSSRS